MTAAGDNSVRFENFIFAILILDHKNRQKDGSILLPSFCLLIEQVQPCTLAGFSTFGFLIYNTGKRIQKKQKYKGRFLCQTMRQWLVRNNTGFPKKPE